MATAWQLAEAVTLRPEAFGGVAFQRQRGVTLEVDAEAYHFLCTCLQPRLLPSSGTPPRGWCRNWCALDSCVQQR